MSILAEEIKSQPDVIAGLLDREASRVIRLIARPRRFRYIVIAARGSSDHAAIYAQYVWGALAGYPVALALPSLFTLYDARRPRAVVTPATGRKHCTMPDPAHTQRAPAVSTRQLETERVIVTEWRFAPGAHTGWHRHAYDYVVVPLTTGRLLLDTPNGPATAELVAGRSYARGQGVEHDVINDNPFEFAFIEIELKH